MPSEDKRLTIHVPLDGNEILGTALDKINDNEEIKTLWEVINTNAMERLGFSDHGPVHFQIVANISLRILRILVKNGVKPSVEKEFGLSKHHAELIVVLASLMHDMGMSIHRDGHEEFSLIIANNLLHEVLDFLPVRERTIVTSEVLHAIISHRSGGKPYTVEAGIVRVADAFDMSEGRSRIPYQKGQKNIHAISAVAIDGVDIREGGGGQKPVEVYIRMNNSAGIFQIDDLLKSKLKGSGIEEYIKVVASIKEEHEKKLIDEVIYE